MMPPDHSWRYCRSVLPKVSRTFALNTRVLGGDVHRSVTVGYLLCRIIDTVEDSPSLGCADKVRFLRRVPHIIGAQDWSGQLRDWIRELEAAGLDGSDEDIGLLGQSARVVACFKGLPEGHQRAGERLFHTMAGGMAGYIERFSDGRVRLADLEDLRGYCYVVAGVVGEFLHDVFGFARKSASDTSKEDCIAFGLGLQMTNIAKDILSDHRRGQRFFPGDLLRQVGLAGEQFLAPDQSEKMFAAYRLLLQEARVQLLRGQALITSVGRRHLRLRLFCIRPLWMAFETLKTLQADFDLLYSDKDVKISRAQVGRILTMSLLAAPSNALVASGPNPWRKR